MEQNPAITRAYKQGIKDAEQAGQYTSVRKFYAWYGLISIIIHTSAIVAFLIWAHHFIKVNL